MKQKLLKTIALGLLALGGVNVAWADNVTIYPTTEINGRLSYNSGTSTYSYTTSPATITSTTYAESTWRKSGYFTLQEWDLSSVDVARIKSITYTFYTKENTGGMLWIYGSSLPSLSITAADLGAAMYSVMGSYPGDTSNHDAASAMENKTWAKGFSRSNVATDVYSQSLTISGDAITTFKNNVSENKIALVVSASANSTVSFYTFLNETYKAKMVIEYYPVSVTIGGTTTYYSEINSTLNSSLTDDATVNIYDDVNMSNRIQVAANKTVNVVPLKAGITITNTASNALSFLSNTANGTLNVGSDTYAMTVAYSNATSSSVVESNNNATSYVSLKNITFSGISSSGTYGLIGNRNGKVYLTDVTFSSCSSTASTANIVYCGTNDGIVLEGNNRFNSCTGYDIYAVNRFKVNETNGVTNTTPIKVYTSLALGSVVATTVSADEVAKFDLQDTSKGLLKRTGQTRYDMYATEAYTLAVSSASAATLVLPFASTIPSGVSCYTLTHTSGSSTVTATPVETTLSANTPVLVNADEGSYKFVNTTNVTSETTGSGPVTNGALTGVYSDLAFTTDNISSTYSNAYILNNVSSVVGFYKVANGLTCGANRCYLTAENVPAGARTLNIEYGDGTTGIETMKREPLMDNQYYNLSGQRVSNPTKGLYILNGKKVIIK